MLSYDDQRFQGFSTLCECNGDSDFLVRLKTLYAELGIGQALDFAELENAWSNNAELPQAWRLELARQTPLELQSASPSGHRQAAQLQLALFPGKATPEWIVRGDNLVLLCAPLVRPSGLVYLLKFQSSWIKEDRRSGYDATLGAGLRQWATQIAEGQGAWEPVTRWLREAGSDPALLGTTLDAQQEPISIDTVSELSALRLLLVLVREQLLLGKRSAEGWVELLMACLSTLEDCGPLRRLPVELGMAHHYCLPLLKQLAGSPRLAEMLKDEEGRGRGGLGSLFGVLAMGALFCESPQRFGQLVASMADVVLQRLHLSSDFSRRYPQCALVFEQQRFARCQSISPQLESPEGMHWYLSILGQLSSYAFDSVAKKLLEHGSVEQVQQAIARHVVPNPSQHFPYDLLKRLDDVELLYSYLSSKNDYLRDLTAHRLLELATVRQSDIEDDEVPGAYTPHPDNWKVLLEATAKYPALFVQTLSDYGPYRDDLARWELIWNKVSGDDRVRVAENFLRSLEHDTHRGDAIVQVIERLFEQDSKPWFTYIAEESGYHLDNQIGIIGKRQTPLLRMLPAMAARYLMESVGWFSSGGKDPLSAIGSVNRALVSYPQAYAELEEKARIKLLPLFDDASLLACAETLCKLFASSSKLLRDPAVALVARSRPETLEASGLLEAAPKARKLVLIGLALSSEPAMVELIARHFKDKAHDEYSRGLSLDALERAGKSLKGLDDWADADLASLQAQAVGLKVPAAVSKYWNDEFSAVLAPLGDALGLQLLQILHAGSEQLPRRARQLFDYLPAGRRSDFALLGARQWIAANGAVEVDWLLQTLPIYGDERIANELAKAVKDWKKIRKQKASAAMRLLCQLPGNFGVALARDLWESGKFSESIENSAREALTEAAQRRGMMLDEFLEQLVPDFGLTHQGLVLDVGPYQYLVRMRPDLSLVVSDEKGKTSKSLPKAKAGEDADKRSLAENQFKALAKNLKPVFKQQSKRLTRLFQLGSSWPAATWQRLFVEHPLTAVIAQSVVWSAEDAQGQPLKRFRPAEDGELIDLDDEPYSLPADAQVHATHPLELDEAERQAWVQHFADYKLSSPIEQWNTPVVVPEADMLVAERLSLPTDRALNRGKFASLVDKWGYIKGQAGDGAQIREHTWLLDGGRWLVTLNHDDIDVYFDPDATVSLENIEVHRRGGNGFERQSLGQLPPAFLNTLLVQAQTLLAHAE